MTTARITVPLSSAELRALIDAAQRDYRHPRDQARAILCDALGLAEKPPTENNHAVNVVVDDEIKRILLAFARLGDIYAEHFQNIENGG